ncbi:hypothetical protein D3C81_776560 [compost metagenome]
MNNAGADVQLVIFQPDLDLAEFRRVEVPGGRVRQSGRGVCECSRGRQSDRYIGNQVNQVGGTSTFKILDRGLLGIGKKRTASRPVEFEGFGFR